jgi:phospholipid transport system transporter-binding protein
VSATSHPVSGVLTFDTSPGLYHASKGWFVAGAELVIDLAQVERADSAGLALMIEWLKCARVAGCRLQFANIPDQVQTLILDHGE